MSDPIILWYRNDLRINDHQPLFEAAKTRRPVIPVYIFDDRHYEEIHGFPKTGGFRAQFLRESVTALKEAMQGLESDLLVYKGKPEEILPKLAEEFGATAVFAHEEAAEEEKNVEKAVEEQLSLKLFWGHTLTHIEDLPFSLEKLPDVFTQARKKVEKYSDVRELVPQPAFLTSPELPETSIPSLEELGLEGIQPDRRAVLQFKGGLKAGKERLQYYVWEGQHIATYKDTRNGLIGGDYSGKFSPWLAHGCLSPREIYWEVQEFERKVKSNSSTYWMVFELLWRDYFRWVAMKYGNKIFWKNGIKGYTDLPMRYNLDRLEQWRLGKTKEPFVNANMKELLHTGYMSNRGRQNVASYLVKDLKVDWRLGAAWFESQLIDYDPTSNYGNWTYVAGVGNDPRENRYFKVSKQAQRYDPDGQYQNLWEG